MVAAAFLALCCWLSWFAVRAGFSRLLSASAPGLRETAYASEASRLASEAVRLAPLDPDAHFSVAVSRAQAGDFAGAAIALERAAALRPGYYRAWLQLGRAREGAGDVEGALAAYAESSRLAPLYAAPRWQRGNTLLRAGRLEEAFAELRRAAASQPSLYPYTIELAWRAHGGDARAVEESVAPETASARLALARFFARHGEAARALGQFRAAENEARTADRSELVADLLSAGEYAEAHELWAGGEGREEGEGERSGAVSGVHDGGFEKELKFGARGFGWQFARVPGAAVSLDRAAPHAGARSLLVEFKGEPDITTNFASQLVLTEPGQRYRLSFVVRTEKLTSGGMPSVAVLNPAGDRTLAQTEALPPETGAWRRYELEFKATDRAALIAVRRLYCNAPCPVFGRAWFDDFMLEKLPSR